MAGIAVIAVLIVGIFYTQLNHQREAIQSIQITFGGIQLKAVETTTATLGLDLNMFNPTAIDVILDHTVFDLYANGNHVFNATILGREDIPSGQTVKVSTDGVISYFGTLQSLLSGKRNGTVTWEMRGFSYFEIPIFGLIQVPFDVSIPTSYSTNIGNGINQVNSNQTKLGLGQNQTKLVLRENQTKPVQAENQTSLIPVLPTQISLQPSIVQVVPGTSAELSGQLIDSSGKGIANQTVYIKSDTPFWPIPTLGSALTNSYGWFTLSWTANQTSWNNNVANVYAVFEGSPGYASSQSDTIHIEVLVSSLKASPIPTMHPQNDTSEIVHSTSSVYQISAGTYSDIPFNLPCEVTASGSFSTYAEFDKNIIVTVLDQNNYDKLQKYLPYSTNYYSGKVQSGNFTLDLKPGDYHLMLTNTYSSYPKTVTIHADYFCIH